MTRLAPALASIPYQYASGAVTKSNFNDRLKSLGYLVSSQAYMPNVAMKRLEKFIETGDIEDLILSKANADKHKD